MLSENTLFTFNLMAEGSNHIIRNSLHLLVAAQYKAIIVLSHLGGAKRSKSHRLHHLDLILCFAVHVLR